MNRLVSIVLVCSGTVVALRATEADRFWPQWRGPDRTGVSRVADPPLEWAEGRNVRWKVEIAGRGSASPVVWGDKLFVTTAIPAQLSGDEAHSPRGGVTPLETHRFVVLCLDRRTGKIVWDRVAREARPHEGAHRENGTWASSSPVTDGRAVYAYFESQGLFAYDLNGSLLWQKDFGDKAMRSQFGEGSTPALHGNRLVVVWDHQGESFVVGLDARTGKEVWRAARDEIDSWATPLIVEQNGRAQAITSGMKRVRSYDLETGELVWQSEGLTMNPIPSPVAADGLVFLTSGFKGNKLLAVRLREARGDLPPGAAVAWSLDRDTPYVPSPLLYDGILYLLKTNSPILSAFDAATGKPHFQLQRLEGLGDVFASPVGAAGRVYITDREGTTLVLRRGPTFEVLAKNTLEDGFDASPALVDSDIYLRGRRYLYAIGN